MEKKTMRLKDKVVIITGAGRGIGRATALRFAQEGAYVVVSDIDLDVAQSVADEINTAFGVNQGVKALPVLVNVADRASVDGMVKKTLEQFGRIDVLINNAGIVRDSRLVKMSEEQFDMVIDVNLKAVFNCTQAVTPIMIEQGNGVILNAASVVAAYGNFGQTNYVASKAGVIGMSKVWARELGRKGIRVNAVAPGFIRTRLTEGIPDKVMTKLRERIPLGEMGRVQDIANAYVWLASDEASYITGAVIPVDGGAVI
jgi:3-oxoacyl-[acyl-carrier protein] reductase